MIDNVSEWDYHSRRQGLWALSTPALSYGKCRITWYHLALFAIGTAMLGMTAGATTVYLKSDWFNREKLTDSVARACLGEDRGEAGSSRAAAGVPASRGRHSSIAVCLHPDARQSPEVGAGLTR